MLIAVVIFTNIWQCGLGIGKSVRQLKLICLSKCQVRYVQVEFVVTLFRVVVNLGCVRGWGKVEYCGLSCSESRSSHTCCLPNKVDSKLVGTAFCICIRRLNGSDTDAVPECRGTLPIERTKAPDYA